MDSKRTWKYLTAGLAGILASLALVGAVPTQQASSTHETLAHNQLVQETYSLGGYATGGLVVVVDTTPAGMGTAHIAAVLPVAEAGAPNTCETEAPLVTILAGSAPTLGSVISGAHNTGIEARLNIDGAGTDMCVFHRTITVADTPASSLTDIVAAASPGIGAPLPADASITVTADV